MNIAEVRSYMKKYFRKMIPIVAAIGLLTAGSAVQAAESSKSKVYLNGGPLEDFITVNDRIMVQLKAFKDPQYLSYSYETSSKTIVVDNKKLKINVQLTEGDSTALVNGTSTKLDAPVVIKNGRTYVPLRFLSEQLGGTVSYNSSSKYVVVRTPSGEEQYKELMSGDLSAAREIAINLMRINGGTNIDPSGEGFSMEFTFPRGEALRFKIGYKSLDTYVEVNADGLAIIKWQKDTLGVNGESGTAPALFKEQVYYIDAFMADLLFYGTVDSKGIHTELGRIEGRSTNEAYKSRICIPIEGEKRTDARVK